MEKGTDFSLGIPVKVIPFEDVKHLLDCCLQFRQVSMQTSFHLYLQRSFHSTSQMFDFLSVFTLFFFLVLLPYSSLLLIGDLTSSSSLLVISTSLCSLIVSFVGSITCLVLHVQFFPEFWGWPRQRSIPLRELYVTEEAPHPGTVSTDSFPTANSSHTSNRRCYIFIAILSEVIHILLIMNFFRKSLNIDCHDNFCYSKEVLPFIVDYHVLYLFIIPVFVFVQLPSLSVCFVSCQLVISSLLYVFVVFANMHIFDVWYAVGFILCLLLVTFYSVVQLHIRHVSLFMTVTRLHHELLKKDEAILELEEKVVEMTSLLGNAAHDLKTLLASFTTGIELIQQFLDSYRHSLPSPTSSASSFEKTSVISVHSATFFSQVQGCLSDISNTNSFMIMAINRCIDFTKASKGLKLVPRNETFILRDIITLPLKCMQNIQQWIIITKKEIPDDICSHIITDQHWLQENVLCLLSNAVKYSHQGVVELSIILVQHEKYISVEQNHDKNSSCHVHSLLGIDNARSREDCTIASKDSSRKGSYQHQPLRSFLRFEVQDCGIGVGEEAAKRLFRPFNQTQRLAGGTGLGLYSLAKRVDALGGYYGVHSRPDGLKGSVCWFEIPYKADGNAASFQKDFIVLNTSPISIAPIDTSSQLLAHNTTVTSKTDEDSLTPSTNSEKHHILIVDDSPTIAKMTAMLLHRAGYEVSIAENGEVALQMIQKRYATDASLYYLILMDLQMPILDGLETMKRICSWENEVLSNAKKNVLLAVSANSDDETIKEACLAGANDFVPKPFTMEYFTHILYKYDNVQYLLDE